MTGAATSWLGKASNSGFGGTCLGIVQICSGLHSIKYARFTALLYNERRSFSGSSVYVNCCIPKLRQVRISEVAWVRLKVKRPSSEEPGVNSQEGTNRRYHL